MKCAQQSLMLVPDNWPSVVCRDQPRLVIIASTKQKFCSVGGVMEGGAGWDRVHNTNGVQSSTSSSSHYFLASRGFLIPLTSEGAENSQDCPRISGWDPEPSPKPSRADCSDSHLNQDLHLSTSAVFEQSHKTISYHRQC